MSVGVEGRAVRVAIIGLGPKGLFALERLLDHAGKAPSGSRIDVDAFESHATPGAGSTYDPEQPTFLRMNFSAEHVNMWWPASSAPEPTQRLSFLAWDRARGGQASPDDYPPRAEVGRYLASGVRTVLAHAPRQARVRIRRVRCQAVRRGEGGWEVLGGDWFGPYDEVLLATGHEASWNGDLASTWTQSTPLVPCVFPVQHCLCPARVAPGATVAIRGFALTFLDAALALTEGRGGAFDREDHPHRLRYRHSSDEVALILPFSRSGRPMLAKPGPALTRVMPSLDATIQAAHGRVAGVCGEVDLIRDLLPIIASTARHALLAAGSRSGPAGVEAELHHRLGSAVAGVEVPAEVGPAQELARSLDVGAGLRAPDVPWALGYAWRAMYPALVSRLSADGLAASQWPGFRRLAHEMERLAFGPAPVNAAKLLALLEAGVIDLAHVRRGRLEWSGRQAALRSQHGRHPVDVVVDAVLPPPGMVGIHSRLHQSLLHDGHMRIARGRRGIDVTSDGNCRGTGGEVTRGLSAIGRPTEDSVVGNDTLSRTLHPLSDRWARRVIAGLLPNSESLQDTCALDLT